MYWVCTTTEYVLSMYVVHTQYIPVCTEYVLSMYSVQGYARCTLQLQSCYLVHFRVQTLYILGVAQCCIGAYYAIVPYHPVLLCSGTYLPVPPCNAPHDPEDFDISIWYSVHPDLHSAKCCADLDVPSTKLKFRNSQDCEVHYKEVCTSTEQYKVVWYYSIVCTNTE